MKISSYSFNKENDPDKNYLVFEIWEDTYSDIISTKRKLEYNEKTASNADLSGAMEELRGLGKDLKKPVLTIQCDKGMGADISYYYNDGRKEAPPNSKGHTIKNIFDKKITCVKVNSASKDSLVYSTYLDNKNLEKELTKLFEIIPSFFEDYSKILKYTDKENHLSLDSYLTVNNESLIAS